MPAYHHTTTVLQHSFTATSMQTCLAPFDFGIAKNKITITGTLYLDANGNTDNLINGTPTGTINGNTVYAYLVDSTGKVVNRTTVNAGTGNYTFNSADVYATYNLMLSTISVNLGDTPPPNSGISSISGGWTHTGDGYGINNMAGTGLKPGLAKSDVIVKTANISVTTVNFGIERLPDSDDKYASISTPAVNQYITLNGGMNPPVLSGKDPEDYAAGGVLTNRTIIIDSVPKNAELYYNNILVANALKINNFNPSLLQVKITNATMGSKTVKFNYSYVDLANMKDPSPASYTLVWDMTLSAVGLVAQVNLNSDIATIKWSTLTEQNTDYFVVERSLDNISFSVIGNKVKAAGNSSSKQEYQAFDNISTISRSTVIYYRVKLIDFDGKVKYSNVVAVRLTSKPGVTVYPNPFHSSITISITTESETMIDINLIDVGGNQLRRLSQRASKGQNQIPVNNLDNLPGGVYLIEITDKKARTTYQKLIKNN